jgi:hypothetical protein
MKRFICILLAIGTVALIACSGSSDTTEEDQQQQTQQSAEELKKKHCAALNGVFLPCPSGEHLDACTHKCVK